ncbi:hypothetical protein [Herbidospora solisilvae]|uniref:hypothetical protein n=1 Tax=Herbidospora solisilvae TaxID=2696284 RepID=UPI001929F353|nr:hypothetical protein [Herbidospora solisilvae]
MALPSRYADVPDRASTSLAALRGPVDGVVELPLHLCWSGQRSFDVGDPTECRMMYQIVITEGVRADVEHYLAFDRLLEAWPRLHRMLGPAYVETWEERFPVLREVAEQAAPALKAEMRRAREAIEARRSAS